MTTRRDLLAGAGLASLAGCSQISPQRGAKRSAPAPITPATIEAAEQVAGLSYTPTERAMALEGVEANLDALRKLRGVVFSVAEAPAQVFNPKLPRRSVKQQKNSVTLGGRYDVPAPDSPADIAHASIAQQGAWLRSGALTSARLTEIYLERIAALDGRLSAFITVTADLACAQAAAADADLLAGKDRGPLHGVPYALKDLADTAGVPTTWGAEPFQSRVPDVDARIVRRLRDAGAVLLGKTAVGAIAYGDRWFGGRTNNPWNFVEGSSGSSAGSAAATAAGLCGFAIGTETLGSIISPSERCGTVGLRPTFGRVSRAGFMALCWSLDKVGPICRTVEDAALVLSKINGTDADDPATARVAFAYDGAAPVEGMTVGYVPAWFEKADDADRAALEAARALGVTLKEFVWPETDFSALSAIVDVEAAAAFSEMTLLNRDDELGWQDKEAWPNLWRVARLYPAVDFVQVERLRRRAMEAVAAAFEGFDALIGPHYAANALLLTNATGHPQLALRAGFAMTTPRDLFDAPDKKGGAVESRTPRGISLWANIFEEGKILALGRALEAKLGVAAERPPGF